MNYHRVSADSILMGTEPSLSEAMRRLAAPKLASVQAQRAKDLSQTNDFWLRGTPAVLASFGTPAKATDITDFTLSLQVRDQLRMDMVLNAPTPAGAQRMFALYRQNESKKPAAGQVSARVEGTAVHFVYTMQESEALLGLRELVSGPAGKQIASLIAAGTQSGRRLAERASPLRQGDDLRLGWRAERGPALQPLSVTRSAKLLGDRRGPLCGQATRPRPKVSTRCPSPRWPT